MDKTFVRNFIIFMVILLICAGSLCFSLIAGDKELHKTDELVLHTQEVINEGEQLASLIEGVLAAQRAYLLTNDDGFLEQFNAKIAEGSEHIAILAGLISHDPSQLTRLEEFKEYYIDFSKRLTTRLETVHSTSDPEIIKNVELIDNIKNNLVRLNKAILKEEYEQLNTYFTTLDNKKQEYLNTIIISVTVGTLLLLVFNGFLLHAQRRRSRAEANLKDTEERFALAIDGTEDGIFDWDITNDKIFFSRRFFEMLGYNRPSFVGKTEDARELIHPEDSDNVWEYAQQYLEGNLSEYHQEFRMKHKSGRWVWIQSRAKALFDKNGKPYRMVGAHTDITHVIQERNRLKAEKEEAQEANRAKSEFLAHMSHEIRTPLTAINGIAEIFDKTKETLTDKQQKLVHTLLSSTNSLKDLINDILDFSKIESGELELDEENFELDEIFENVISMMALKASEKGVSFVFDYQGIKDMEFYGDDKRIRQILVNLINNALKFTDEGGVTIKAELEDREGNDFLRIDVADTGIGIEPENFDMVFERFKQADSSVSRKYGGTGLGLPISRNLAKLMGGDIYLSSEVNKGSTFTVLLPIRVNKNVNKNKTDEVASNKLNDKIRAELSGDHRILVVEDYEGNIVVLSYILDDVGAEYHVAKTGKEAVDLWRKNHYDIVLMDIQMPEMDGFAATKEIRHMESSKQLERTPIIGMTAHALVGDKDKCIEAGMDAYLPKPIVENDLKREILKYLKQKRKAA